MGCQQWLKFVDARFISIKYMLTEYQDVSFVISDEKAMMASSALQEAGFTLCSKRPSCDDIYRFQARPPLARFHLNTCFVLSLSRQSNTPWEL